MPAPVKNLVKLGFNPRQAALLFGLPTTTETQLIRQGKFNRHQAKVLKSATPTAIPFVDLVRIGKFTRHQANAIRQA